jgi:hypothetical protein
MQRDDDTRVEEEAAAAAAEAAAIGGVAGDEDVDPAQRPVVEAGGGYAEGFELAEEDLIEAASHGDSPRDPVADAYASATPAEPGIYAEGDEVESTQVVEDPGEGPDDPGAGPGLTAER